MDVVGAQGAGPALPASGVAALGGLADGLGEQNEEEGDVSCDS